MGTYVLHEQTFSCQAGNPFEGETMGLAAVSVPGGVAVLAGIGAPHQGIALHENGLSSAEGERVGLQDDVVAEPLELARAFPQPLLEAHGLSVHTEARTVEGRLRVEAVVDQRRDEL